MKIHLKAWLVTGPLTTLMFNRNPCLHKYCTSTFSGKWLRYFNVGSFGP